MSEEIKRSNVVLFPDEIQQVIDLLRAVRPFAHPSHEERLSAFIKDLHERSQVDDLDVARQEMALYGLSDCEFDRDDSPAVSPGDDPGAYVQIWQWIPDGWLNADIREKHQLGEFAESP